MLRRLSLAALLLWTGAAWGQAENAPALKPILQQRYALMKAAVASGDGDAVGALLAPGFASEDVSGKRGDAAAMAAEISSHTPDPNKASDTTLLSITQHGNLAIVSQRYHMTTIRASPLGMQQAVELVALSTDTWIKSKGVWLLQQTVTDEISYSLDGREQVHKVHDPGL